VSREERSEDVTDRISKRFGEEEDSPDNLDTPENNDTPDNPENTDMDDVTDQTDEIDPKEDWTGRNIYVPDDDPDLLDAFDGEYDRMQYECDWEVRKQQHYYPVLIKVGVDEIEKMDGGEFTAVAEDLGLR